MSTIMIVDDEVELMNMVSYQFKARGHRVVQCANGVEALDKLTSLRPDLIILDLNMPKMGGIEAYQNLCAGGVKPSYPVLILTARANTETLFKDFDVDGFMTKPFDVTKLIAYAEEIIKRYERTSRNKGFGIQKTKCISLVEDNPEMLETIGASLLAAGYGVIPMTSGHQAFHNVPRDLPQAVLINLSMPDIAGDVLAMQLKALPQAAHIPVFVYVKKDSKIDPNVLGGIRAKAPLMLLVEFSDTMTIIEALDKHFSG